MFFFETQCSLQTRSHVTPQTRLDKTVQSPIYSGLLETVADCRQLTSHHRHGQDKTVLSCPRLRCELGISGVLYWSRFVE